MAARRQFPGQVGDVPEQATDGCPHDLQNAKGVLRHDGYPDE
jgi:hypothetical protein